MPEPEWCVSCSGSCNAVVMDLGQKHADSRYWLGKLKKMQENASLMMQ